MPLMPDLSVCCRSDRVRGARRRWCVGLLAGCVLGLFSGHCIGGEQVAEAAHCDNGFLAVRVDSDGTLEINDLRTSTRYSTTASAQGLRVLEAREVAQGIDFKLEDGGLNLDGELRLEGAELVVALSAEGEMPAPVAFPGPLVANPGENLILPFNQGISYPVDDSSIDPRGFLLFAGANGLCMPWYGATAGESGWMAIVETADDASVEMVRRGGLLELAPQWLGQKGSFGYRRVIRYIFLDQGGYVAMAKRYRSFAEAAGLVKTLEEKRKQRPAVDRLPGAPLVWFQSQGGGSPPEIYREMKQLGMDRVFWHGSTTAWNVAKLNDAGALTGCYDIYQDAMNPKHFPRLDHINRLWVTEAWENDDIILDKDGSHYTSWPVSSKDGERIFCGVVCDARILGYAKKRITSQLLEKPIRGRMIDTAAATPWRECHHPDHPMTRTESKNHRIDLLRLVGEEFGIVCGTESGHAEVVPYVDFFDGMMSLATYRVPNSGHKPFEIWDEVPEVVSKFQTGHFYRIPLWELVFHDCVVSYWYWGDFNNKLPALWDRRDLINALYGTPPVWAFDADRWEKLKDRFAKSYKTTVPVAKATGFSEMLSHEWLTEDRTVQKTAFANGVAVTANFGEKPYETRNRPTIPPHSLHIEGLPNE